jgi:hypothetical protein
VDQHPGEDVEDRLGAGSDDDVLGAAGDSAGERQVAGDALAQAEVAFRLRTAGRAAVAAGLPAFTWPTPSWTKP